ncbi:MAG: protein jag [Peptostreptococcaceae bacterium]|nr:protein jag [Peptostreptococcaceae bacterium]
MQSLEKRARTVEAAINIALDELMLTREEVEIEIVEEPKNILGLINIKQAVIKVWRKADAEDLAVNFLQEVLIYMGEKVEIDAKLKDNTLYLDLSGPNMAILIGKRGTTLDSLQYLTSLVVNKGKKEYIRVIIDTESYRNKREKTLIKLAEKLAYKARKYKKDVVLEPMNPYERRIIHSALQGNEDISTRSEGEDPYRKVRIYLNKKHNS